MAWPDASLAEIHGVNLFNIMICGPATIAGLRPYRSQKKLSGQGSVRSLAWHEQEHGWFSVYVHVWMNRLSPGDSG